MTVSRFERSLGNHVDRLAQGLRQVVLEVQEIQQRAARGEPHQEVDVAVRLARPVATDPNTAQLSPWWRVTMLAISSRRARSSSRLDSEGAVMDRW